MQINTQILGCYGVSDVESFSSTDSLCQSAPWFCEACSAGIGDPSCELCPNKGGIYKETDVGKWVHLVCALYVPGVAFGEVSKSHTSCTTRMLHKLLCILGGSFDKCNVIRDDIH